MNAQEIFDTVAKHLAQQGTRSVLDEDQCAYRGHNGMKCAVGCLIADGEYTARMDSAEQDCGVQDLAQEKILPARLAEHVDLLVDLQKAHDRDQGAVYTLDKHRMPTRLWEIAQTHRLSPAILDTLTFPEVWA